MIRIGALVILQIELDGDTLITREHGTEQVKIVAVILIIEQVDQDDKESKVMVSFALVNKGVNESNFSCPCNISHLAQYFITGGFLSKTSEEVIV